MNKNSRIMIRYMDIARLALCVLLVSCGNSSPDSSGYVPVHENSTSGVCDEEDGRGGYDECSDTSGEDAQDIGNIRLTGEIVQCNKCMGYGMVQDDLYGQPKTCKFCWLSTWMRQQQGWTGFDGRYGLVDAVFNTLPADYFDELELEATDGHEGNSGGSSQEEMESEIARREENIAQLESMLEYVDGSISRTQIQQQIIEEQSEIRRLKNKLDGME